MAFQFRYTVLLRAVGTLQFVHNCRYSAVTTRIQYLQHFEGNVMDVTRFLKIYI